MAATHHSSLEVLSQPGTRPGRTATLACSLVAAFLAAAIASAPAAAGNEGLSRAQVELFDTPHLENVSAPQTLRYAFTRRGTEAMSVDDRITLLITEVLPDGGRNVTVEFLSGQRERRYPPFLGFHGNPLIMVFLQHDVEEMSEATGGSDLYFRNRLRSAFGTVARVEDVTFSRDGREEPARLVTVEPYVEDPMIDRFHVYRHKRYEFLLSGAVPGGVARMRTVLPGGEGHPPAVEETVTFSEATP